MSAHAIVDAAAAPRRRLRLRERLGQFSLLVLINAFVGAMGALAGGVAARFGVTASIGFVRAITVASGIVVATTCAEHPSRRVSSALTSADLRRGRATSGRFQGGAE